MHLTAYSSFAMFVGLWGGPYLDHIYGYGLKQRGELLLIPALAQMAGASLWGPMDRLFGCYKTPVLIGAGLTGAMFLALAAAGTLAVPLLIGWMILFGLVSGYTPVLIAHGKSLFAPHHVGRGLTLLNMASMGGVFVSQAITGLVIDLFPSVGGRYPLAAYRTVFLLQAGFIVLTALGYLTSRDPRRD